MKDGGFWSKAKTKENKLKDKHDNNGKLGYKNARTFIQWFNTILSTDL